MPHSGQRMVSGRESHLNEKQISVCFISTSLDSVGSWAGAPSVIDWLLYKQREGAKREDRGVA